MLKREIAAEKNDQFPCRRKRKREVLRFSWAPCEKLRGLREVAAALGCGATWTSLDDGRRGLLKAVRKLRSAETITRPSEGIRIAYLPDPVKSQGARRPSATPPPCSKVWNVAEVCVIPGRRHPRAADGRCVRRAAHSRRLCRTRSTLGKAGGERVRAFVRSGGGYVGMCWGLFRMQGVAGRLPECSVGLRDWSRTWCRTARGQFFTKSFLGDDAAVRVER